MFELDMKLFNGRLEIVQRPDAYGLILMLNEGDTIWPTVVALDPEQCAKLSIFIDNYLEANKKELLERLNKS